MSTIDRLLWLSTAVLSAIALARLMLLNPKRNYALFSFAVMLAIGVGCDAAFFRLSNGSHAYAIAWESVLPLRLVSHAWCAFAAYQAVVSLYPNIGRFATWLFAGALGIAALLCLGTLPWELQRIGQGNELFIRSMFLLYRWVDGLSAGGLILACGFLMKFPRPLKRMPWNLIVHMALLTAYFSAGGLLFLVENLTSLGHVAWLERAHFGLIAALYVGWMLGISRKGEELEPWEPLDAAVLAHIDERAEFSTRLARSVSHAAR